MLLLFVSAVWLIFSQKIERGKRIRENTRRVYDDDDALGGTNLSMFVWFVKYILEVMIFNIPICQISYIVDSFHTFYS